MRIPGLASGMDTDAMVESMMKAERLKVNRFEHAKQTAVWKREAYNNINKTFANFILNTRKEMGITKVSNTGVTFGNSYKNLDYLRKALSSDESVATAKTTSSTANGRYNIKVENLAEGAIIGSKPEVNGKGKTIKELLQLGDGDEFKLNINGAVIELTGEEKLSDLAKKINSATVKSTEDPSKEVSIGLKAFYDEKLDRFFIQTDGVGEKARIEISNDGIGQIFVDNLGLAKPSATGEPNNDDVPSDKNLYMEVKGKNANVNINGFSLQYESNNISFNDLDIELKGIGTTNINVSTNTDGIMEKIEKLVNDYNELIDSSAKLLGEKRYPSYHPLSQEEKKAMHENDVKLWEEKAKSGMLSNDELINSALQSARNEMYKTLVNGEGEFKHITEIGISTEKYSKGAAGGKLQIDKGKLRAAIEKDPEGVMELLFKDESKVNKTGDGEKTVLKSSESTKGVFTRIYDSLTDGMKSIIDKSGPGEDADLLRSIRSNILIDFVTKKSSISDLDKEVLDTEKRIESLNAMLFRKEESYYAKFANMEKMLQKMHSQSNWLSQQLMR